MFLPLNTRLTVPELHYIVGDAAPVLMIHDTELAEVALSVAKLCKVASTLLLGPDGSYEAAIAGAKPLDQAELVTLDDISTIMYTSGTTGQPKGAIITHGMTFWNCVNLGGPAYISPSSVLLTVLPLFHTGGLNCYTNPVLHSGGTVLIMRAFDPGLALAVISDPAQRVNVFFGVPSIYQFMAQHASFATADFSRLVIGGVGGAPMPVPLLKVWEARGVALQQGYGMTETSPAVLTLDKEDAARKAGSSGKPVLHTEVRIVAPSGLDAEIGELGELWVKGPNITPGYWNRPDANASSFTDGWLHTGDAARIDEEGFYYIVDRWKDMYISGGENVYPAEVENVLHQLDAIAEAAVIGIAERAMGRDRHGDHRREAGPQPHRGRDPCALRRQSRALQAPPHHPVRRRPAAQRHRQDPQADPAEEFCRAGARGRRQGGHISLTVKTMPDTVIARSEATKQSSFLHGAKAGLLRGACHRAALCADPLARNDVERFPPVLPAPSSLHERCSSRE